VAGSVLRIAFLHCDDIASGLAMKCDHLARAIMLRRHDHVRQKQREGLVADQFARTPDCMAEAERLLLPCIADLAGFSLKELQSLQFLGLSSLRQRIVQFELDVEMILDHGLVAAGYEDEMLDSGLPRLVDDMLDHRPVENGQHFLGHGLGRGKKARTESSHGEYCLS